MSNHQKMFMDQIFPDKVQYLNNKKSNLSVENKKKLSGSVKKVDSMTSIPISLCNEQKSIQLNLQPVQHNIAEADLCYKIIYSAEARNRIVRLVNKQREKILDQSKSTVDNSALNIDQTSSNRLECSVQDKTKRIEVNESANVFKRKIMFCDKIPSYKGFNESSKHRSPQKKVFVNDSSNNSADILKGAKEENRSEVPKMESKRNDIHSLNEGKKLIRTHLQRSTNDPRSTTRPSVQRSSPPPNSRARKVDRSPPRKHRSPIFSPKYPCEEHNGNDVSTPQYNKIFTSTPGTSCKSGATDQKMITKKILKIQKDDKKLSTPDSSESRPKKKTYNPEEIRKYILKKKVEKLKKENDRKILERRKKEEKEQIRMILVQQKESFQNLRKASSKTRQDVAAEESKPPTAWQEIFAAMNSRKEEEEAENNIPAVESKGTTKVVSTAASETYEISTKVSFSSSCAKNETEVLSDKTKLKSSRRLQKIQESARLLTSRLDYQTVELVSYFKAKGTKNVNDTTDTTRLKKCLPITSSSSSQASTDQNYDQSLCDNPYNPEKNIRTESETNRPVPDKSVSSHPNLKVDCLREKQNYFRIPDDLAKLDALSAIDKKKADEFGRDVESLPRDMFPSENIRKKLRRKASLSNSENKTPSLFKDARASRSRLSFGAESTFDEFNWKLIKSFLAKKESRLMYQGSMSRLNRQALQDHSKSMSSVTEMSIKPQSRTRRRGMDDDVYPQVVEMYKNKSLVKLSKETSDELSDSYGYSDRPTFSDASDVMPIMIQRSPHNARKTTKEYNLKLGEKYLAKKEQTLKQRKEKLTRLLERLDSLDCTEREVSEMEMEFSRRWKNFSDSHLDGNISKLSRILRETSVQTNSSFTKEVCNTKISNDTIKVENRRQSLVLVDHEGHKQPIGDRSFDKPEAVGGKLPDISQSFEMFSPLSKGPHHGFSCTPDFDPRLDEISDIQMNVVPKISNDSLDLHDDGRNLPVSEDSLKADMGQDLVIGSSSSSGTVALSMELKLLDDAEDSQTPINNSLTLINKLDDHMHESHHKMQLDEISNDTTFQNLLEKTDDKIKKQMVDERFVNLTPQNPKPRNGDPHECLNVRTPSTPDSIFSKDSLTNQWMASNIDGSNCQSPITNFNDFEMPIYRNNHTTSVKETDSKFNSGDRLLVPEKPQNECSDPNLGEKSFEPMEMEEVCSGEIKVAIEGEGQTKIMESATNDEANVISKTINVKDLKNKEQAIDNRMNNEHARSININDVTSEEDALNESRTKLMEFITTTVAADLIEEATETILEVRNSKKVPLYNNVNIDLHKDRNIDLVSDNRGGTNIVVLSDEYIDDNYPALVRIPDTPISKRQIITPTEKAYPLKEVPFYIPRSREELIALISEALDIYWTQRRNGEQWNNLTPPKSFLAKNSQTSNVHNVAYRMLLFDLVGEMLIDLYSKEEEKPEDVKPWHEVVSNVTDYLLFDKHDMMKVNPPNSLEELRPKFIDMALSLLPPQNNHVITRPSNANKLAGTLGYREGRNARVESILARESKLEEPDWINYDKDSVTVKNLVADQIFEALLEDTVASVRIAYGKKISSKSHLR